jgi:hypothetical protein
MKILLDFAPNYDISRTKSIELPDRSAFFDFYIDNFENGIIFNVREVEGGKE